MADPTRPYDLVLFGATGFTGGLTAEYLAETRRPGAAGPWPGRNRDKLAAVRDRLAAVTRRWPTLPLLHCRRHRRRLAAGGRRDAPGW